METEKKNIDKRISDSWPRVKTLKYISHMCIFEVLEEGSMTEATFFECWPRIF